MIWALAAVIFVVIVALVYRRWQSTQHLRQLILGFPAIQKSAFNNVREESENISLANDVLATQFFRTAQKFGCAYTIEISSDKTQFIHHISGKAPGKPVRFVVENMLLLMSTLLSQLKAAGIETKEKFFTLEQSDSGTHHLEFKLTEPQQAAFRSVIES